MKKNIIKTGLLAIMSVAAVSCIDLDTAPYDRETDLTAWDKPESAINGVNAWLSDNDQCGRVVVCRCHVG